MIARLNPAICDLEGKPIGHPRKRHGMQVALPMAAYLTQPLAYDCRDLEDLRAFLKTCRYVSDKEQFGRLDYWQPPEEFEKTRKGDCDCFALWAWRQLLGMGYEARYVLGLSGPFGHHHAWVQFRQDNAWFVLEPTLWRTRIPSMYTLYYQPWISVAWDGDRVLYFDHAEQQRKPPLGLTLLSIAEYAELYLTGMLINAPFVLTTRIGRICSYMAAGMRAFPKKLHNTRTRVRRLTRHFRW